MSRLQSLREEQISKYNQLVDYLNQDEGYWLNNGVWDYSNSLLIGNNIRGKRYINFAMFKNEQIKNEVKYFVLYKFKEERITIKTLNAYKETFVRLSDFLNSNSITVKSFTDFNIEEADKIWKKYLLRNNLSITTGHLKSILGKIIRFYQSYKDVQETIDSDDIWYVKDIPGLKVRATQSRQTNRLNFNHIPMYYRDTVKRYFKSIIMKKSFSLCYNILITLNYFFKYFYNEGYSDGFIENLSRDDIERYIYYLVNDRSDKNKTDTSKYVTYVRNFLEYIQIAQYEHSPRKEITSLIFNDDVPKRELSRDVINRVKFIPEPILNQIDNNIMDLDRPYLIPIYILLRETGWRGTDILNLRYDNCLEQIWNSKEQKYNYYLCGEITKTGIAQLKIPIRDNVAEMVQKCIDKCKQKSTEENNPNKYLFNKFEGTGKGYPYNKYNFTNSMQRLIKEKDIRDSNGELYHFKTHSLRHSRAKEYVEQGMGISVIQQILGHRSLQMTVHYATVAENTLYEKWKATEELELFKLNVETKELEKINIHSEDGENLIKYEYVKKNLDAVKVPFGVCFKPSKLPCKQQMNHCLTCASFCTTVENIPEYEEEIAKVKQQVEISNRCGRDLWVEKNKEYLNLLEETLEKIKQQKLIHKNGMSREEH